MKNPDISIIVPVYNTARYLPRCLDSLFSQKFSGTFEVIAVDDASTDGSLHVLESYRAKDPRLNVEAHAVNKKLSAARVTGMKVSRGDYIMHVDSDDWLVPGALEILITACKKSDADIIVFNYATEDTQQRRRALRRIRKNVITDDKLKVQRHFFGTCVNKIVKRSIVKNMIYGETGVNIGEDLLYATEILLRGTTVCLLPEICYVYFANTGSLTWNIAASARLWNSLELLTQLAKIAACTSGEPRIARNAAAYVEKLIYEALAINAFIEHDILRDKQRLLLSFSESEYLSGSRMDSIISAAMNKYYCIAQVIGRSGFRHAIGIVWMHVKQSLSRYLSALGRKSYDQC